MASVKSHILTSLLIHVILKIPLTTSNGFELTNANASFNQFTANIHEFDECLSHIMRQNMHCNAFGSLTYSTANVPEIVGFISKNQCYSITIRTFDHQNWIMWNDFYIIFADSHTELIIGLLEMRRDVLWNTKAKFIVAVKNIADLLMEEIFQEFLNLKLYDVLFLNHVEDNNTFIYTYNPFQNGKCGDDINEIIYLGKCLEITSSKNNSKKEILKAQNCVIKAVKFLDRPRQLVQGKEVVISIVEQYVLDTYAQHSNFTVDYNVIKTERDFGIVYPNGTVTGLLSYLHRNIADLAVGSTVIIMNRASLFDYIYGFNYASFKLYTSALGSEMWKKVYKEFDLTTYLIILLFYFVIIVVCILILKIAPKIPHSRIYVIVKLWGFFYLGNGTEPYPKTKRLRSVILCWIWFTFFISSFYNSDMYSLITGHVQRVRQIEPNKLNSIPYKPCIPKVIRTFFYFAYNEALPESFDTVACYSIDGALDTTANGNDLFTVQMKPSYVEREIDFIDDEGNRKLDSWDFGSDIVLGFYIARGFPFKAQLQAHAQYMFESGLVDHYKQYMYPPKGAIPRRKKGMSKPFVIGDFRVHFAVLCIGVFVSTLTFIVEIIYYRRTRQSKRFSYP